MKSSAVKVCAKDAACKGERARASGLAIVEDEFSMCANNHCCRTHRGVAEARGPGDGGRARSREEAVCIRTDLGQVELDGSNGRKVRNERPTLRAGDGNGNADDRPVARGKAAGAADGEAPRNVSKMSARMDQGESKQLAVRQVGGEVYREVSVIHQGACYRNVGIPGKTWRVAMHYSGDAVAVLHETAVNIEGGSQRIIAAGKRVKT
jgi:hypothetical protein